MSELKADLHALRSDFHYMRGRLDGVAPTVEADLKDIVSRLNKMPTTIHWAGFLIAVYFAAVLFFER